jgi:tetratricopeptide (TPR) repeat protein
MSRSLWLAVSLLAASSAVATEPGVASQLAAGDAALATFDLTKAIDAYTEAVKVDSNSYEANWKLARARVDQGTLNKDANEQKTLFQKAVTLAENAVRINPKGPDGHIQLAIAVGKLALFLGGKQKVEMSKEVKTEAEAAMTLDPKADLPYHVLGVWNREMAELNWFLRKFAEMLYGKFPPASLETAIEDLHHASELAPDVVPHRVELGITLAAARRWDEADKELEHALEMKKAWVTDDYYKDQARQTLERVKSHLR